MMTLLQAIAVAKGHDELSRARSVAVLRQVDGKQTSTVFDISAIRAGSVPDPEIQTDDVIVVEKSKSLRSLRGLVNGIPLLGSVIRAPGAADTRGRPAKG